MAAADRRTSSRVVLQLHTEIRISARPRQTVPESQQVPSRCTRAITSRVQASPSSGVADGSSNRTSTWLSTTSFTARTPGAAESVSAKSRACAQHRSISSESPRRPSDRNTAYTAKPRARRENSGVHS